MARASNFSDGSTVYQVGDAETRGALVGLCAVLIGKGSLTLAEVPAAIRDEVAAVVG